jgi:asparagine synthase (glutamine-hydrolysing)
MCAIAGIISLDGNPIQLLELKLKMMLKILTHRGIDDCGLWQDPSNSIGFAHNRLSIQDLDAHAKQPMVNNNNGNVIVYNGEIYNHSELRKQYFPLDKFYTNSDTETLLTLYEKFGIEMLHKLDGMYSFAIFNKSSREVTFVRDRLGIKPFYYLVSDRVIYFASEAKALIPFLNSIDTNPYAFKEYLTFQYGLTNHTMFNNIERLSPGCTLSIKDSQITIKKYWDLHYSINFDMTEEYAKDKLISILSTTIKNHGVSDVDIGSFVSGGIDSSLIYALTRANPTSSKHAFNGAFKGLVEYDESIYASRQVEMYDGHLHEVEINSDDFINNIRNVIYHLDYPVAGPGSFAQYMVAKAASSHVKVIYAGQGGDELFGGYARYILAYFEQCIKASINGEYDPKKYILTIESIIPNLRVLKQYSPMIKEFWREGLFDHMDLRYFRLINRSNDMINEINWDELDSFNIFNDFELKFNKDHDKSNGSYFDKMSRFDLKYLIPALLHVEDRVTMAHGLESRVPLLDHKLVEFMASVPANIKYKNGNMKYLLKSTFADKIHPSILNRVDKMGFPVPISEWCKSNILEFINDLLSTMKSKNRPFINSDSIRHVSSHTNINNRKLWALISLELWYQEYHDKSMMWGKMLEKHF